MFIALNMVMPKDLNPPALEALREIDRMVGIEMADERNEEGSAKAEFEVRVPLEINGHFIGLSLLRHLQVIYANVGITIFPDCHRDHWRLRIPNA